MYSAVELSVLVDNIEIASFKFKLYKMSIIFALKLEANLKVDSNGVPFTIASPNNKISCSYCEVLNSPLSYFNFN